MDPEQEAAYVEALKRERAYKVAHGEDTSQVDAELARHGATVRSGKQSRPVGRSAKKRAT